METNQAAEHLQIIRTLMERSAVYRRALAPIMLFAGVVGIVSATLGLVLRLDSIWAFGELWLSTALVVVTGALLIARRQAFKDKETFWSPPTRRVVQAILPAFTAGLAIGGAIMLSGGSSAWTPLLVVFWILFYGCALHASGFFMLRGVKVFGWLHIAGGCGVLFLFSVTELNVKCNPHWFMGLFFGVLHVAYGAYLYITEKRRNEL